MAADSIRPPDPAVLALARAMARLAAREDHEAEQRAIEQSWRDVATRVVNVDTAVKPVNE